MLEIYNEEVFDLIQGRQALEIRDTGEVDVPGLKWVDICGLSEVGQGHEGCCLPLGKGQRDGG